MCHSVSPRGDESLVEYVSLPAGAEATGLSFYAEEKRKAWVAVSCTDGAVRLIDASPERTQRGEGGPEHVCVCVCVCVCVGGGVRVRVRNAKRTQSRSLRGRPRWCGAATSMGSLPRPWPSPTALLKSPRGAPVATWFCSPSTAPRARPPCQAPSAAKSNGRAAAAAFLPEGALS